MYTSSSLTKFFRYYFPIIFGGLFALSAILSDISTQELTILFLVFAVFAIPTYLLTFRQLRYMKAMHDKLITETLNYEEEIEYDQINYIYQSALSNPVLIRISYTEKETGITKKFYALGSLSERMFTIDPFNLRELELTKFIRRKVQEFQPNYDESQEPSRWITPLIIFVLFILMFIFGSLILNETGV